MRPIATFVGTLLVASSSLAGCSADGVTLVGTRADGLVVACAARGEQRYACDPQPPAGDGDDVADGNGDGNRDGNDAAGGDGDPCASWTAGGAALVLWPPNHELHAITLEDCASARAGCRASEASAIDGAIVSVSSDEPLEVGAGGDGNTPDGDLAVVDARTVLLRAERQGGSDGRVYRIEIAGPAGPDSCEVHVPHDRGPYGGALDSGAVVTVPAL